MGLSASLSSQVEVTRSIEEQGHVAPSSPGASSSIVVKKKKENEFHVVLSPPHSLDKLPRPLPTVFRWKGDGRAVYITGSFNGWKNKLPMVGFEGDFSVMINLSFGVHQYKFIVDGKWRHAEDQPLTTDAQGNLNNFIEVKPFEQLLNEEDVETNGKLSPIGEYSQVLPNPMRYNTVQQENQPPPTIPPHLKKALLNTVISASDDAHLPLPPHVMLKHVYCLPRKLDTISIYGISERYKTKFVTTIFYRPFDAEITISQSPIHDLSLVDDLQDNWLEDDLND